MLNNLIKNIDDIKILDTFLKKIESRDDTDIKYEGLYKLIKKYHIDATPDFKNYGKYISNIEEAIIQSIDESTMKDNDEEEDDTTSLLNSVSFYYKNIFSLIYSDYFKSDVKDKKSKKGKKAKKAKKEEVEEEIKEEVEEE